MARLRSLWRGLFRRSDVESEMTDEVRFHLEARTEDLMRCGLSEADAARRARIEFGAIENYKDRWREARGLGIFDDLRNDCRYGLRMLSKSPSFAITAILTLALGIGANTGLFTFVNTLLFRPVPARDPWSLYQVTGYVSNRVRFGSFSYGEYTELTARNSVFRQVIAESEIRARTPSGRLGGYVVSGNYFSALGAGTVLGRPIQPEDATPSAPPVIVLGHAAWVRQFAGDPQIIGKTVVIGDQSFTVIGVATSDFTGLEAQIADFWAPLSTRVLFSRDLTLTFDRPDQRWLRIIGRLQPDVSPVQAQSAMKLLLPQITKSRPKELRAVDARLISRATFQSWDHADAANVIPLVAAFGLILLIACTNLSNILLARALSRQRELGVRLALGASRGRILRQLLTESVLVSVAAGGVGLALSHWSLQLIRTFMVSTFSMKSAMAIVELSLDYRVFFFALFLAIVTGIVFGLAPALHATRPDVISALKLSGGPFGRGVRSSRLRDGLVVAQFALSLVLLIGAGLLIRSATNFAAVSPGFDVSHAASIQIVQGTGRADTVTRLSDHLKALAGIESVAISLRQPLRGSLPLVPVSVGAGTQTRAGYNEVSPEYFRALQIPIVSGRAFTEQEARSGAVAVVSQATARRFWPDDGPLDKSVEITVQRYSSDGREAFAGARRTVQIVGVAKDVISGWLWDGVDSTCVYLPASARANDAQFYDILVRARGTPAHLLPVLRAAASSIDPLAEVDIRTMDEVLHLQVLPFELASWGAAALGALGLALASIGIYGVTAYVVNQRTREIGIRMALGAARGDVLRMLLRSGGRLIGVAVACGLVLGLGFARVLSAMMFKVQVTDPATFVIAPLVLAAVGLLATYLPARRATCVDPNAALRLE